MIGRILDKYQILEEVGQGGMAVVYKGLDTSLQREVAVKVLHPHLASHEEARRRFEREAHAVAKLRHENILEIFDYSGTDSPDSYIVTEFIRGSTLKRFVAEHPPAFPELGALIVAEVCRALAHAHAFGVLHRDVKPENIMIRDDGVVKLTDFGIAQIVDAQRMTVTGQLLGSPAYMSPEHIEGRPLDFRTDVFAVGILLYQLCTGELPFKGRNPHEILKRIAECRYLDARVVNPLVGDRVNKIIARALARDPNDRYPDVAALLDDLLGFLAELELGEPRAELQRFFADPVPYEQALRQRLIAVLARRGRAELAAKRVASALEHFNRVLTIDPSNEEVLRLMDRLARRRRVARGLVVALGIGALAGVAVLTTRVIPTRASGGAGRVASTDSPPAVVAPSAATQPPAGPDPRTAPPPSGAQAVAGTTPPGTPGGPTTAATPAPAPHAPAPTARVSTRDGAAASGGSPPRGERDIPQPPRPRAEPERPARAASIPSGGRAAATRPDTPPRTFRLVPSPKNASYSVDGAAFTQVEMGFAEVTLGPGAHTIVFRHPACSDSVAKIAADEPGRTVYASLPFKPTQVIARCPAAAAITVDGAPVLHGSPVEIHDLRASRKTVDVVFLVGGRTVERSVVVTAGAPPTEVSCEGE